MKDDVIVEEARTAGQAYIDSFHGDWKTMLSDLRRRAENEGRRIVSYPPRRVNVPVGSSSKAPLPTAN
jgi:hypothetical protein